MMAADGMPVIGMRMPGEAPAATDVAVVMAPPDDAGGENRAARPDPAPELVAVAVERVEPAEHADILDTQSDGPAASRRRLALPEI